MSGDFLGQEDCLLLNIYSPIEAFQSDALAPVLVWIYGGGFLTGSARYSNAISSNDHDQVWWVWSWPVAWRGLSSGHSELSRRGSRIFIPWHSWGNFPTHQKARYVYHVLLDHSKVPGNQGLLDQLMALELVQANIALFGGDPSRVWAIMSPSNQRRRLIFTCRWQWWDRVQVAVLSSTT